MLKSKLPAMLVPILALFALPLVSCSQGSSQDYGGNKNHVHDLVVLSDSARTVLVASHIGLYRSTDRGKTWSEPAGASGQAADGLMLSKLAVSAANPSHVFMLAGPRPDDPGAAHDQQGIYASTDAGATWRRASTTEPFGGAVPYTLIAAPGSGDHLYALRQADSVSTLFESTDGAAHWATLPALPASSVTGVAADPTKPGKLYVYSVSSGLFESGDDGAHWSEVTALKAGIFGVTLSQGMVWASGDTGLFLSRDSGSTFSQVDPPVSVHGLVAPVQPAQAAWGIAGSAIVLTRDAGATWSAPATPPQQPVVLYALSDHEAWSAGSYPLTVARTTDGGGSWQSLMG